MPTQETAYENVVISPAERQGALVHVIRGGKTVGPAASDELPYILASYPAVAALASGDGKAALEALARARAGYEAAAEALTRERAELEVRCAKMRKAEGAARKLAEALAP
jgi:hypothetical protein